MEQRYTINVKQIRQKYSGILSYYISKKMKRKKTKRNNLKKQKESPKHKIQEKEILFIDDTN